MSAYRPTISGRKARRAAQFARRRKGAGWTRPFRKGRDQRHPFPTLHTLSVQREIDEAVAQAVAAMEAEDASKEEE